MCVPDSKKRKRDQCSKILSSGKQCAFYCAPNSEFCTRHGRDAREEIGTNTLSVEYADASTNTHQEYHSDLLLAEETIIGLLQKVAESDKIIDKLEIECCELKDKIIEKFMGT
jgi:hypothetical protein